MAKLQVDVEGGVRKQTARTGLDEIVSDSTAVSAHNELLGGGLKTEQLYLSLLHERLGGTCVLLLTLPIVKISFSSFSV